MEIATVPAHYVRTLLRSAQRNGLDRERILGDIDISADLLTQEKARVPTASFVTLCAYLTEQLQDENCGMMKQPTRIGSFAMMCNACINCPDLGQFLQRCTEFHAMVNDCMVIELLRDGDIASYSISPRPGLVDEDDLIIMILLSITHRLASWAIGQTVALDSVAISRERPGYAHEYNFLFMAPVQFAQNTNSIRFSANYLDMPIRRDHHELEQFLNQSAMRLMSNPDLDNSLVSRIRSIIKHDVDGNFPEFERVADKLHLTTATLRRRLRSEGSSYQQLKDDIRRDTAIHLLSRGTASMEQVAESVGFSEPTSFFRAFKRWTGVTPRAYLKSGGS